VTDAYVLDVSVALAWCFADEATHESRTLLRDAETATIHVPGLWYVEVTNVLLQAERRKRLSMAQVSAFLGLLAGLEFEVDLEHMDSASVALLELAHRHRLTAYDALYLDLAMRLGVPLATRDKDLVRAAARVGVAVVAT
jgi:predicted nucleic acid-binding protein